MLPLITHGVAGDIMDIKAYITANEKPTSRLRFIQDEIIRLMTEPRGVKPPFDYFFLMEWHGPVAYPQRGKLGGDTIVWAHDGQVWTVGPQVKLPSSALDSNGMLDEWAVVAGHATKPAAYVSLLQLDHCRPIEAQKQAILVGTHAATATNPDGSACPDVRAGLARTLHVPLSVCAPSSTAENC